jgi:hypothetical protein
MTTDPLSRFVRLALGLLAGCSSTAPPPEDLGSGEGESSAQALLPGGGEIVLRAETPRTPPWIFRLVRTGDAIAGHVVRYVSVHETAAARAGRVTGSIRADGAIALSIEVPEPDSVQPSQAAAFVGRGSAAGFEGVLDAAGALQPAVLTPIVRGTTDEAGSPIAATLRATTFGACPVDVTSAEFFSLRNEALERDLNAIFAHMLADAPSRCAPGVDAVAGGAEVTLLTDRFVSVKVRPTLLRGDTYDAVATRRYTFDVASGRALALFGDVLEPGSTTRLGDALAASVALIRDDVLDADGRAALTGRLRAEVLDGTLARRFGLEEGAIVFDLIAEAAPARLATIRARFDDLRDVLLVR